MWGVRGGGVVRKAGLFDVQVSDESLLHTGT